MNQTASLSAITIKSSRQRTTFEAEALSELADSIGKTQLLQAPVMREEGGGLVLVAGERRIRALQELWLLGTPVRFNGEVLPEGTIPYVTLGQLDPLAAEEAELEENLRRKDLTWQESAAAMSRLHRLRSVQAQAEGKVHTVADTAMETKGRSDGSYQESVRRDIIVAKHLNNPEVAKAKTADEAFKILKRQEETARNVERAVVVGKTFSKGVHRVFNVDCLTWMRGTEAEFDVIVTDPPYGMGADSFGDGGGGRLANNEHHYKDDYEGWKALMMDWCPLSFQVTKEKAHAYVFCDLDNFHELKGMMQLAGWYVFRTPFICTKPNSGRVPLPSEGPRRQWEMILYAIKGHKNTTAIYPDVITTTGEGGFNIGAQKPVPLFLDLLRRSVRAGDKVLDSFAGSGTIIPAAHELQCEATALEMNPEHYSFCLQRIEDLDKPVDVLTGASLGNELQGMLQQAKLERTMGYGK